LDENVITIKLQDKYKIQYYWNKRRGLYWI